MTTIAVPKQAEYDDASKVFDQMAFGLLDSCLPVSLDPEQPNDADPEHLLGALLVLSRAGQGDGTRSADQIERLVRADKTGNERWQIVLAVATALGGPAAQALEALVHADDCPVPLDELSAHLPYQASGLWRLALLTDERRLAQRRATELEPEPLAELLLGVSERRRCAGDRAGALTAIGEAVDLYRRLAEANPAAFTPDLAASTGLLANLMADQSPGGGLAAWSVQPVPDGDLDLAQAFAAARSWPDADAALRAAASVVTGQTLPASLDILLTLYPGNSNLDRLRQLVTLVGEHGLEPVLAQLAEQHALQQLIQDWISTRTWTESLAYLREHHDELAAPQVIESLGRSDEPVAQQHAAILTLTEQHSPEAVFEVVTDTSVAADLALAALDAEVSRSTPSILKPCKCSNGENSPATPSMRSARRAVSWLSSAIGRMSTSIDIVASADNWSSGNVPRIAWEPTTITSDRPTI